MFGPRARNRGESSRARGPQAPHLAGGAAAAAELDVLGHAPAGADACLRRRFVVSAESPGLGSAAGTRLALFGPPAPPPVARFLHAAFCGPPRRLVGREFQGPNETQHRHINPESGRAGGVAASRSGPGSPLRQQSSLLAAPPPPFKPEQERPGLRAGKARQRDRTAQPIEHPGSISGAAQARRRRCS